MNYIEVVRELNTELYEKFGEVEKVFEYSTTGFEDAISFNGAMLWNSEMEINDHEPFEPFIRRIFNEYIDKMQSLKFLKNP